MVLGRSLFSDANTLALAAGQKLDNRYIQLIHEHGYHYTFIQDEGFEDVTAQDALTETTRMLAESAMSQGVEKLTAAVKMKEESGPITRELLEEEPDLFNVPNVDAISRAVSSIVKDIIDRNVTLVDVFAQVARSTYIYRHAVNVAALSVLIGRQFGYTSRQLRELALGALLHDFGKVCLGDKMAVPKSELEGDDLERFKEHPTFGSILVQNTNPTLQAEKLAILNHHEWQNGNGYPQGIRGDNQPPTRGGDRAPGTIHRYAEIIAVAESFDNLVNGNGEVPRPLNPADALGMILSFSHKRFNQAVCHAFSQIVSLYPTGSMVQIRQSSAFGLEGYYAVVKEQGTDASHPILILYADPDGNRVKPKTLDFGQDRELSLKLMI
jgi:HD-GYP domain-containing protein (c-di-GMP phosphodiesterase class II)